MRTSFIKKFLSLRSEWEIFRLLTLVKFFIYDLDNLFLRDETDFARAKDFCDYPEKEKKINLLLESLDEESKTLVKKILERQSYIYRNNVLDKRKFSPEEKKEQKKNDTKIYKKIFPKIGCYPCETFIYHNGLKLIAEHILKKTTNKDIIDAGAFYGDSALVFNKQYNFRKIYSFEPQKNNMAKLREIKEMYGLTNVEPVNCGLGSKNKKITIENKGINSSVSNTAKGEEIKITTIDDFCRDKDIDVGLIKMDIEGEEYDAVFGARETIRKNLPVLVISIYHTAKDFFEIKPLIHELNPEYKFIIRKINPFNLVNETVLIAYCL